MKLKLFPLLVLLTAFVVSGSAAYYSIFGLSKLFSGAAFEVIIMASSLELAKIVIASLLQREWSSLHIFRRIYLTISVFVLVVITSAGIYGFLSNAYQITSTKDALLQSRLNVLELKKSRYSDKKDEIKSEQQQVLLSISELRNSLSNPGTIQYLDRSTNPPQLITTTSSSARKSLENQLEDAIKRRDKLGSDFESTSDSIAYYEVAIIDAKASSSVSSELGPLKYLSGLTGKPMDVIVNWFLLLIIFVFDPLAIVLITTANLLFTRKIQDKNDEEEPPVNIIPDETQTIINNDPPESYFNFPVSTDNNEVLIKNSGSVSVLNTVDDITVNHTDDTISVTQSDDTIVVQQVAPKGMSRILDSNLPELLAGNLRRIFPFWKNESDIQLVPDEDMNPDMEDVDLSVGDGHLNERQLQNMTHHEVQEWYKRNRKIKQSKAK